MTTDPVDQLTLAMDTTERVIDAMGNEQWGNPTPCSEWNVREVVRHVVTGNYAFASILAGAPPARPLDSFSPDDDLLSAYRESARRLVAAFRHPGILEQVFTIPIGSVPGIVALHLRITEVLVHGWDLARATGQIVTFPEDLAEAELTLGCAKLADIPPDRRPFAPPQPVVDGAPAIDRLAACLGRSVTAAEAPTNRERT